MVDEAKKFNWKTPFLKMAQAVPKEHMKRRIVLIAIFAILTLIYVFAFMPRTTFEPIDRISEMASVGEITADRPLEQEIMPGNGVIKGLQVEFNTFERVNRVEYYIDIVDEQGNIRSSNKFNGDKVTPGEPFGVPVSPQIETHEGERYFVRVWSNQAEAGKALGAYVNISTQNQSAAATVAGSPLAGSLVMTVGYETMSVNIWIGTVLLIVAVSVAILFWGKKLHINILVLVLIFGVLFSLITPILDSPDEAKHCAKAFIMVNGDFVTSVADGGGHLAAGYQAINDNSMQTIAENTLRGIPFTAQSTLETWGSDQFFLGYIPQTVGLWCARLFHADLLGAFYMGRIFNVLFYAICAFFAVKIAPKFKLFLAVVALMPMSLMIAGTYNSDGMIYGLSLLLGAYFIDLFFNRKYRISWKHILLFMLLATVICMKKYNLVLLAFLPFFIPAARYKDRKTKWLGAAAVAVVAVIVTAALYLLNETLGTDGTASALTGMNERGASVGAQIAWMLQNPATAMSVVSKSIMRDVGDKLAQLFSLGQLSYEVYGVFVYLYIAFLAVVAFSYTRYEYKPELTRGNTAVPLTSRGLILLVAVLTVVLTYLMLYLTWSPVGADNIEGVQGRYFIPIFFLLPFVGQNVWPLVPKATWERSRDHIQLVAVLFASVTLLTTLMQYY